MTRNSRSAEGATSPVNPNFANFGLLLSRCSRAIVIVAACCSATIQTRSADGDVRTNASPRGVANAPSVHSVKGVSHQGSPSLQQFAKGDWPFRPLARPSVPIHAGHDDPAQNQIDAFVNKKLQAANLKLSPPADKLTLLRRITYDLTGLPPTVEEQKAFLTDGSPAAYTKVVDRLLASPRYGEQWAQHWLDLVRYSESEGFKVDHIRRDAFRYRDYVIRSFNNDLPYDQFIREQIAGDELEPKNKDALIATGFLRLYPEDVNASNLVQQRQEILDDITETTGLTFLGLTIGCARCHDHKFDPITQARLLPPTALLRGNSTQRCNFACGAKEIETYHQKMSLWEQLTKPIRDKIDNELSDERHARRWKTRLLPTTQKL